MTVVQSALSMTKRRSHDMDNYADNIVEFEDRISSVIAWANDRGLTDEDCVDELRRIANELAKEATKPKKRK